MAGHGETQERTWVYISSKAEDLRPAKRMGTGLEDAGVDREESVWADFSEAFARLAWRLEVWAKGLMEGVRIGVDVVDGGSGWEEVMQSDGGTIR